MKSFVADTNTFLRFVLKDIPKQYDEARKLFSDAKAAKIEVIVPQIVIFEIAFALTRYYGFPKSEVIESLNSLLAAPYFKIQDKEALKKTVKLFLKHNISLVDSFLLAYAEEKAANIFSFDKRLKKIKKTS